MRISVKALFPFLLMAVALVAFPSGSAQADVARKLPAFEMKDLAEREHRLTDERFQGKKLVIVAFGTWQQVSVDQARELQKFHDANPEVEIIAFIVDGPAEARDFVRREGLTFPCYKADPVTRINSAFNRVFRVRTGKTLTLNRMPFVIIADAERNVRFAEIGLVNAERMAENLP
jgi:peroxiredoxin